MADFKLWLWLKAGITNPSQVVLLELQHAHMPCLLSGLNYKLCIYLIFFWTPKRESSRNRWRTHTWTTYLQLLVTSLWMLPWLHCRWAHAVTHLVSYFHSLPRTGLDILKAGGELQYYSSTGSTAPGCLCSSKTVDKGKAGLLWPLYRCQETQLSKATSVTCAGLKGN